MELTDHCDCFGVTTGDELERECLRCFWTEKQDRVWVRMIGEDEEKARRDSEDHLEHFESETEEKPKKI